MSETLLQVKNLKTYFKTDESLVKAVDDVSFEIKHSQTVCIVGESGCGKSVTALSILGLINNPGYIEDGQVIFDGKDLMKIKKKEFSSIRGNELSMIFQEPMSSLNPLMTIGRQIVEPLMEHKKLDKIAAFDQGVELIKKVGISRAEEIMYSYPHELSGGMLQRIMIAIALSCNPKLLIADEPTTALDVTIQAQILDLINGLKEEFNTSILLITHDLGVVAEVADYVVVMYAGKIIEEAPVLELFKNNMHPYTKGLLKAKPILGQRTERLHTIDGNVPNLSDLKPSCYFSDRCNKCMEICKRKAPTLQDVGNDHKIACWLYQEEK
jgi:oligopeptide/dipeptide ABC transporter, ATP-binding protein, C-terminal domain